MSRDIDRDPLLSVQDVAHQLGVSKTTARDLIRRLPHVRIGTGARPLVRVRKSVLSRYISAGGDVTWQPSIDAAKPGGLGDTTAPESDGNEPPNKKTAELRSSLPVKSKWRSLLQSTPQRTAREQKATG